MRDLCLHILGEPQQSGEPRFPLEQQVVGETPRCPPNPRP